MLASTLEPLHTTLTDRQRDILDESGFTMLTTNAAAVLNSAFLLALNYVRVATAYAESFGGSTVNDTGWGRDKDEDEWDDKRKS